MPARLTMLLTVGLLLLTITIEAKKVIKDINAPIEIFNSNLEDFTLCLRIKQDRFDPEPQNLVTLENEAGKLFIGTSTGRDCTKQESLISKGLMKCKI